MTNQSTYTAIYERIEMLAKRAQTADELTPLAHAFAAVKNSERP